jgi:uncharacterized membrane protein
MDAITPLPYRTEEELLRELRALRDERGGRLIYSETEQLATIGQRAADAIARFMGSWKFIIGQSTLIVAWVTWNTLSSAQFDPYPFIFLNLALSLQAAYAAPVIMQSQNRQANIDRKSQEEDFRINIKSELEIELLHQKIDFIRESEIAKLIEIVDARDDEVRALTTTVQALVAALKAKDESN